MGTYTHLKIFVYKHRFRYSSNDFVFETNRIRFFLCSSRQLGEKPRSKMIERSPVFPLSCPDVSSEDLSLYFGFWMLKFSYTHSNYIVLEFTVYPSYFTFYLYFIFLRGSLFSNSSYLLIISLSKNTHLDHICK